MSNFGVMKSRIADETLRSDLAAQIANAIQSAISDYSSTRFWFNEKIWVMTTVVDQKIYDFATATEQGSTILPGQAIVDVDRIQIGYSAAAPIPDDLIETDEATLALEQYAAIDLTARPTHYVVLGESLRLWPIPDAEYTLLIYCHAKLPALSLDADTNAWMTAGEDLIRQRAKYILFRDVLRDPDGMTLAAAAEADALTRLQRASAGRITPGKVTAWGNEGGSRYGTGRKHRIW